MKNIKNKIKFIAAAAVMGASFTACSLDMLPLNDVVLENYWTNKSDVKSVVNSCYVGLQEGGYISNMIVWGETRSDNVTYGQDVPEALKNLMKGNIKTTNGYCNWSAMYTVINRCNSVIYYAPMVAESDPNYTPSDLAINLAECKALRAISYLTLIKTFKDVPYQTLPSIDDNQDYIIPATPFRVILDSLITDIEGCKNDAPLKNIAADGYASASQSTGRITRAAMYSILAELYLWKASDADLDQGSQAQAYRKCIECCDWVINFKKNQYLANDYDDGTGTDLTKQIDTEVYTRYGLPLLAEEGATGTGAKGAAFTSIFGTGNSFESIFEITFMKSTSTSYAKNTDVGLMYGGYPDKNAAGTKRYLIANESLLNNPNNLNTYSDQNIFTSKTDYRTILPFQYKEGGTFLIRKYVEARATSSGSVGASSWIKTDDTPMIRSFLATYQNWIIYRLSEILLFRAEAEIELANILKPVVPPTPDADDEVESGSKQRKLIGEGAVLGTADELYQDAFDLISAVYLRSNPAVKTNSTYGPQFSNYQSEDPETYHNNMSKLLMLERQREFLFEGKRYYDLVRQARRDGNTLAFRQALSNKFGEAGKAVTAKLVMMDFMYMPYQKRQIDVNPNLVQNSAYEDEEESVKN